jgi:hypothetical protein
LFFVLGWAVAKAAGVVWLAVTWCWSAAAEGAEAARGPSRAQQIERLTAQIETLTAQLERFGG